MVDKLFRILFIAMFVAIVVTGVVLSYPKYRQQQGLSAEKERILRRIEDKKAEIADFKEKQRRFNTDREFVENLARRNRRVYPGELVFIFDD